MSRINQAEFPISPNRGMVSDEPTDEVVISDELAPNFNPAPLTDLVPLQPDQEA